MLKYLSKQKKRFTISVIMQDKIGEYFIKLDLLSFEQAEIILEYQKKNPVMKFGEIAVKLGYLELEQISVQTSKPAGILSDKK